MSDPFEETRKMTSIWTDFATKMMSAGMSVEPGESPPDAAKQIRGAVFEAMSQYVNQFMRSEQFLEMMKKSMDASIAWRKQMNDFLTQAHHAGQGVALGDVADLHATVRHLEQRTLDCIETICHKLDEISKRLEAIEQRSQKDERVEAVHE